MPPGVTVSMPLGMTVSTPLGMAVSMTLTVVMVVYMSMILGVTVSVPLGMAVFMTDAGDAIVTPVLSAAVATATFAAALAATLTALGVGDIVEHGYTVAVADEGAAQGAGKHGRRRDGADPCAP